MGSRLWLSRFFKLTLWLCSTESFTRTFGTISVTREYVPVWKGRGGESFARWTVCCRGTVPSSHGTCFTVETRARVVDLVRLRTIQWIFGINRSDPLPESHENKHFFALHIFYFLFSVDMSARFARSILASSARTRVNRLPIKRNMSVQSHAAAQKSDTPWVVSSYHWPLSYRFWTRLWRLDRSCTCFWPCST